MMETMSDKLAAFAETLRFEDIPEQVIERAKYHLLDSLGITLAATREPFADGVTALVRDWGGTPQATLLRYGDRIPAAHAALANGSFIHGIDFDDTHHGAVSHLSTCVVPTALAVGESTGASGREILTAMVAGYEIFARIGGALSYGFHAHGFHATPICGAFAAAAIAGRLLGHDPKAIANAMGVVGSQAAGLQEFLDDGSWVKRLHPGWASHAGIAAAQLCGHGFLGPRRVLEGRFGLYATHVPDQKHDPEILVGGLGERWETLRISIKPYPCCHLNHSTMGAARDLVRRYGITDEQIASVEAVVPEPTIQIVCEPIEIKRRPNNQYAALFSLPYCLAVNVVKGQATLDDFEEENLGDPRVLALAGKVTCKGIPDDRFPKCLPGAVKMTLNDGRVFEFEESINRGHPDNPMDPSEVEAKFRGNAGRVLPESKVEDLLGAVMALDEAPGAGTLIAACCET